MTAGLRRTMVIFVLDMLCIAGSFFLALWMRFEFRLGAIPQMYLNEYLKIIGPWIVICLVVFQLFRLYNSIWSFVSIDELFRIILAYGVLLAAGLAYVLILKIDMPRSFYFAGFIMSFMSTTALRFSYRFMRQLMAGISTEKSERDRILMIGAGEAGRQLIREINSNPRLGSRVVCIIDDNPSKRRRYLDGVEIAGGRQEIPDAVKKYQSIRSSSPSPPATDRTARRFWTSAARPAAGCRRCRGCSSWSTARSVSASSGTWSCRICWAVTLFR